MTPEKILRNLDNGYLMNRQEQADAAQYIRQLQESNNILQEGIFKYLEELAAMRRDLMELNK